MVLQRELTVCALELLLICIPRNAKYLVVVSFTHSCIQTCFNLFSIYRWPRDTNGLSPLLAGAFTLGPDKFTRSSVSGSTLRGPAQGVAASRATCIPSESLPQHADPEGHRAPRSPSPHDAADRTPARPSELPAPGN